MTEVPGGNMRDQVEQWLTGEGWSISELKHDQTQWLLRAQDQQQGVILVGQSRAPEDQLRLQADINIDPAHREKLGELPEEQKEKMLWSLRFSLLKMNLQFTGLSTNPERITVFRHLYLDGLNKNMFMDSVGRVRSAVLMIIWSFRRKLDPALKADQDHQPHQQVVGRGQIDEQLALSGLERGESVGH